MGQVMQRAGGGKVSTTNLAAANIDNGVTVTVKQGSKTVQQVTGSLKTTTSGLAAGNIRNGVTVTVKQGSKTVQQVTGTFTGPSTSANAAQVDRSNDGTGSCSLYVPAGTFKAFLTGSWASWDKDGPAYGSSASFWMTFNGASIGSGATITGPGTLIGYTNVVTNYHSVHATCSIFYG